MPSREGIAKCWKLLRAIGLTPPFTNPEDGFEAWLVFLGDVDDERLIVLTAAWVNSEDAKYNRWPMPGALRSALAGGATPDEGDPWVATDAWADVLAVVEEARRCGGKPLDEHGAYIALSLVDSVHGTRHLAHLAAAGLDEPELKLLDHAVRVCGGWTGLVDAVRGENAGKALRDHRFAFTDSWSTAAKAETASAGEAKVAGLLALPTAKRLTGPRS